MSNGQKTLTPKEGEKLKEDVWRLLLDTLREHGRSEEGVKKVEESLDSILRSYNLQHETDLKKDITKIYERLANWATANINLYNEISNAIHKYIDTSFKAKVKDLFVSVVSVVKGLKEVFGGGPTEAAPTQTKEREKAPTPTKGEEVKMLIPLDKCVSGQMGSLPILKFSIHAPKIGFHRYHIQALLGCVEDNRSISGDPFSHSETEAFKSLQQKVIAAKQKQEESKAAKQEVAKQEGIAAKEQKDTYDLAKIHLTPEEIRALAIAGKEYRSQSVWGRDAFPYEL